MGIKNQTHSFVKIIKIKSKKVWRKGKKWLFKKNCFKNDELY